MLRCDPFFVFGSYTEMGQRLMQGLGPDGKPQKRVGFDRSLEIMQTW
jgi:hypothetical protein